MLSGCSVFSSSPGEITLWNDLEWSEGLALK